MGFSEKGGYCRDERKGTHQRTLQEFFPWWRQILHRLWDLGAWHWAGQDTLRSLLQISHEEPLYSFFQRSQSLGAQPTQAHTKYKPPMLEVATSNYHFHFLVFIILHGVSKLFTLPRVLRTTASIENNFLNSLAFRQKKFIHFHAGSFWILGALCLIHNQDICIHVYNHHRSLPECGLVAGL